MLPFMMDKASAFMLISLCVFSNFEVIMEIESKK